MARTVLLSMVVVLVGVSQKVYAGPIYLVEIAGEITQSDGAPVQTGDYLVSFTFDFDDIALNRLFINTDLGDALPTAFQAESASRSYNGVNIGAGSLDRFTLELRFGPGVTPDPSLTVTDWFFQVLDFDVDNNFLDPLWNLNNNASFGSLEVRSGGLGGTIIDGTGPDAVVTVTRVTNNVVPEPSTFALLGIGGAAVIGYGWRRKRRQAA